MYEMYESMMQLKDALFKDKKGREWFLIGVDLARDENNQEKVELTFAECADEGGLPHEHKNGKSI